MSAAERRERGTLLCHQLAEDVGALALKGLGAWPACWKIVGGADANFVLALARWEASGSEEDIPPLRSAYFAILDAWRRAAAEYEREKASR